VLGILARFHFNGFAGTTYFDTSAIFNPDDTESIKMLFLKNKNSDNLVSGCQTFPCTIAYNKWDNVATLLGNFSSGHRHGALTRMGREDVTSRTPEFTLSA
jgi:hypothetical protein